MKKTILIIALSMPCLALMAQQAPQKHLPAKVKADFTAQQITAIYAQVDSLSSFLLNSDLPSNAVRKRLINLNIALAPLGQQVNAQLVSPNEEKLKADTVKKKPIKK